MDNIILKAKKTTEKTPVDIIISKIKDLIKTGVLKPGDKLPAERKLSLDFGFGRTNIREALHKLEFYGIIKTLPQSGSVINGLDINTLDGLISDVLSLQHYDFASLVETRYVLETQIIKYSAQNWEDEDLVNMEKAHESFINAKDEIARTSYDFAFHRAIAEASHNSVLKTMLLIILPDIISIYQNERVCNTDLNVSKEHENIINAIKQRDSNLASELMGKHLERIVTFAKSKLTD